MKREMHEISFSAFYIVNAGSRRRVEANPQSPNSYAALANAFFVSGEKTLAIRNYEKSFKMNPGNFDMRERLKQLWRQSTATARGGGLR